MTREFALRGDNSKQLLTYQGKVITHTSRGELEFLVPIGASVIECPSSISPEDRISISKHPDCAHIRFPLQRKDFR